jgi:hypothetical protein
VSHIFYLIITDFQAGRLADTVIEPE